MSERTDDKSFPEYSWTDDVKRLFADREGNWDNMLTPTDSPAAAVTTDDPNTPVIRAPNESEQGYNGQMPYNHYMENPWVQALSGFGKGIVRGIGLEVHPSLNYDRPLEGAVSGVTKALHPGLDIPKALAMTSLQASGKQLTPEEQRAQIEGTTGQFLACFQILPRRSGKSGIKETRSLTQEKHS